MILVSFTALSHHHIAYFITSQATAPVLG